MKNSILFLGALLLTQVLFAQDKLHSVLILNEGRFDYINGTQAVPVSLGKYDPANKSYTKITEIANVRFASDLKIHGDYILIAADSLLIKLDRYSYQELGRVKIEGIRKLAISNDKVFVSRGEYLKNFKSYLNVYSLQDLSLETEIDTSMGPKYATEGLAVVDDKLYVAINNAFDFGNEIGALGTYDINQSSYSGELTLPDAAANPDNLMIKGNKLYTLNNHSYDTSSITEIDLSLNQSNTSYLQNVSAGCGTSALYEGVVLYQELAEQTMYSFDTDQRNVTDSVNLSMNFYGLAVSPFDGDLYTTTTDFANTGALLVYRNWNLIDSLEISVSAGNIAFDIRNTSSVENIDLTNIQLYPNPSKDLVFISGIVSDKLSVEVISLEGRSILKSEDSRLDLSSIPRGIYLVSIQTEEGSTVRKLNLL